MGVFLPRTHYTDRQLPFPFLSACFCSWLTLPWLDVVCDSVVDEIQLVERYLSCASHLSRPSNRIKKFCCQEIEVSEYAEKLCRSPNTSSSESVFQMKQFVPPKWGISKLICYASERKRNRHLHNPLCEEMLIISGKFQIRITLLSRPNDVGERERRDIHLALKNI